MTKSSNHLLHAIMAALITICLPVAGNAECEFVLSCDNVEKMVTAESFAQYEEEDVFVPGHALGIYFKNTHKDDLRNHIRECEEGFVSIRSEDMFFQLHATDALPAPGWFALSRSSKEKMEEIAHSICPDMPIQEVGRSSQSAPCEYQVSCENVESIQFAPTEVRDESGNGQRKGFVAAVSLKGGRYADLAHTIELCPGESVLVKAGDKVITSFQKNSIPYGGGFPFAGPDFAPLLKKAEAICPDRIDFKMLK